MISLIVAVVLTTVLFLIFKAYQVFKVNTFQAVVTNYFTCIVVGGLFSFGEPVGYMLQDLSWLWLSVFMGALFISTFYLMAWSAQEISISVSTLSSKLSLILPVVYSLVITGSLSELNFTYALGFGLVLVSILLAVYKPNKNTTTVSASKGLLIAVVVFLMTGAVDTSINIANHHFINIVGFGKLFPVAVFIMAFVFGGLFLAFKIVKNNERLDFKSVIGGVALGIPNYFSIYFILKALGEFGGDGAFVFPIVNMSVIILCALAARIIYKEKLNALNVVGLLCGVLAIALISYK